MKKALTLFLAVAFVFSLVSTNVVFSTECHDEKAAQAEEGKKDAVADAAESEGAKAQKAAEPEKADEAVKAPEADKAEKSE